MMTTGAQAITTIHLVILALLALLTVAGIMWGMKLRRERRAATERREEHQAEIEAAPSTNTAPREERAQAHAPVQSEAEPAPPVSVTEPERVVETPIATERPAPDGPGPADQPVTILKGLGPKLATRLGELGITTVGDIAALDPARAEALDAQLGAFTGRMTRDRWIEQARFLAAGDRAGFEAVFGKL